MVAALAISELNYYLVALNSAEQLKDSWNAIFFKTATVKLADDVLKSTTIQVLPKQIRVEVTIGAL